MLRRNKDKPEDKKIKYKQGRLCEALEIVRGKSVFRWLGEEAVTEKKEEKEKEEEEEEEEKEEMERQRWRWRWRGGCRG